MMEVRTIGLVISFGLMLLPLLIFKYMKLPLIKATGVAFLRMVVQLAVIGLILSYIFRWDHPAITIGWLAFMVAAATYTVLERLELPWTFLLPVVLFPLLLASGSMLAIFAVLVVKPDTAVGYPLVNPRLLIPVFGMILGNSMNATAQALERLASDLKANWRRYYSDITMGARPREAAAPFIRNAMRASQMPRIMNMASVGIISLPGMMAGLIVQGADPTQAIKYQMMVMAGIFVAVTLAVGGTLHLYVGKIFDNWYLPVPTLRRKKGLRP
ncbi:MAG: ABC transporter permease [Candidatus Cloacimonetes bacterium]|nr:ABC transporter permease [Candidatus Cloacimonadota bacterium]